MNGKERIFAAFRHESADAVPWVPFAGVHAGKLKGYNARQVLSDGDKLLASLLEVNRVYDPDGQPVLFDLQMEAEILGCELMWADKVPPSVVTHPLAAGMEIPNIFPEKNDGRLPFILQAMRTMNERVGHRTALYGLVTGPLTLATHLRGTEIFMDMFDHADYLRELLAYCTEVGRRVSELYITAGMHVIAVVDPFVSQISPKHFQKFLSPLFHDLFAFIRQTGAFSSFFVCGNATKNIDVMCYTEPDGIAIDENIDLVSTKQITDKHNITLEGNIPLTSHMLLGSQQDNMKYVLDLLEELAPNGGVPANLIISPGCDLPYDIPIENVVGTVVAIRDPVTARAMLANYHSQELDLTTIQLPDYENLPKPLIEVFTLDSSICSACGHMKLAAKRAADELGDRVDMVEYKITTLENIARMKKLGVQILPSILINGQPRFSSLIPSNHVLLTVIREYL